MKPYTVCIDINLPRDQVVELFDNPENMIKWQNGLQSVEPICGDPGQPGAKTKLIYLNGKHRIELIETVTHRNLPEQFDGTYHWASGSNTLKNRFIELGPDKTRWESTCEYEFTSIMLKLMGFLMPGKFKDQNMKFLKNFKAFCEDGISVQDSP